jgi:hypothetical protein
MWNGVGQNIIVKTHPENGAKKAAYLKPIRAKLIKYA